MLKDLIDKSRRIVFVTGAGISTSCGIPDFRSSEGIYTSWLTPLMFSSRLFNVFPWWFYHKARPLYGNIIAAKPSAAHKAIAELGRTKHVTVVTQNVDGLHQKAGSRKVYELHGTLKLATCQRCRSKHPIEACETPGTVPRCACCGGVLKPDIVFFGDDVPTEAWLGGCEAVETADLIVVCGTSLRVSTAADMLALRHMNAKLAIVNKAPTSLDYAADLVLHQDIDEALKDIV